MKDYSLLKKKIKLIDASAVSLEKHITELFENGYDQGCVDGQKEKLANAVIYDHEVAEKKAYERGLDEAWEAAKKLCQSVKYGGLEEYCSEIFEKTPFETFDVFDYTASEAIAKIKAYVDKQKQDDWRDIPSDEMTLDQARRAVKQLRAEVLKEMRGAENADVTD